MADPVPPTPPADRPPPGEDNLRRQVVDLIEYLYGPLLVSVGFSVLYALSDPAQEALIGLATDLAAYGGRFGDLSDAQRDLMSWRIPFGLLVPATLPYALWVACRIAVKHCPVPPSRLRRGMMALIAGLPVVALIVGPLRAAVTPEARTALTGVDLGLPGVSGTGNLYAELGIMALPGIAGLVFMVAVVVCRVWAGRARGGIWPGVAAWVDDVLSLRNGNARNMVTGVLAMVAGVILWGLWDPTVGLYAGPLGVAASFAGALALGLAVLTRWSHAMPGRMPLTVVVLLVAFGLSSFWLAFAILAGALALLARGRRLTPLGRAVTLGVAAVQGLYLGGAWISDACDTLAGCNMVQPLAGAPFDWTEDGTVIASRTFRSDIASPSASIGFDLWNRRRLALQARDGTPRPIRVVAAQGGGLYAAYQTAWYLAERADTEPGFARSVFAISGVSGGSVGGGVFWAIRASGVCDGTRAGTDCHRRGVRAVLEHDYLSPALAGLFFRDALDSVLPVSAAFTQPIDRGRALEGVLARRLADWIAAETGRPPAQNPMHLAMSRSWSPDAGLPLLLMNATDVGSGGLSVLSPVRDVTLNLPGRLRIPGAGDVSVVTAMVTSARFPLVSPPLRVRVEEPDPAGPPGATRVVTRQLVDGGYFDNSGLETLADLLPLMVLRRDRAEPRPRPPIEVIVFTVAEGRGVEPPAMKGTLAAPVAAFTGAWRSRRDLTVRRIEAEYAAAGGPTEADVCFVPARMTESRVNFTVSWYLATATFAAIRDEMARAPAERGNCPPP
jgi:predicted acylesterase/phospholipase RssA